MKWKPMRIAAALFVMTALTSNMICGTLAKYTTSDTANDAARVAKWGITVLAEGELFGDNYDAAPSNTISTNADGSITVKSFHSASVGESKSIVAPGTKNDTGLAFGISGVAETALRLSITIRNQNIALRPNVYYIIHTIKEEVTEGNYSAILEKYGLLYVKDGNAFKKADTFTEASAYFWVDNKTDLTARGNWPYCPVVFELVPSDGAHGLEATRQRIRDFTPNQTYPYYINANDKSLDIISFFLQNYSLNAGQNWPGMSEKNVFERTVTKEVPAGTNLESISLSYNKGLFEAMTSEKLTWQWDYQQPSDKALFDNADNILGRLAAEKMNGPLEDDFVVIQSRTYGWSSAKQLVITPGLDDATLILPEEYIDYCLDTMFSIEMNISQID